MAQQGTETPTREWFIITPTADGELRVVAVNGNPSGWRKLFNVVRGTTRFEEEEAIKRCFSTGTVAISGNGGCAAPIDAPVGSRLPVAAALYSPEVTATGVNPEVGTWEWRPNQDGLPPTLHLSETAADLLGIADQKRDRSVYGPADLWTRTHRVADVIDHMTFTFDSDDGATRSAETVIRADDGELRLLHIAESVHGKGPDRVVRAVIWRDADATETDILRRCVDMELVSVLANATEQRAAILDTRFPALPIVCKWITPHEQGIGHGASTGQTSGWHPDDLPRIWEYMQKLSQLAPEDPVPTLSNIRVRRAGGGWLEGYGRALRLVPALHPSVWFVHGERTAILDEDGEQASPEA